MDWKNILARLAEAGLTQMQIAERCEVSQSTISDIARGATKNPSYPVGARLQQLLAELPVAIAQAPLGAEPAAQQQAG